MPSPAWPAYDLLVRLAVHGLLVPSVRALARRGRGSRADLDERLGRWGALPSPAGLRVVVHAVSAGEMAAAGAFVLALARRRPDYRVLLTTGTREGRIAAERLRARVTTIEGIAYLPWDRRRAVTDWLRRLNPGAVVVVEPEFWPNLFDACRTQGVPLLLLNARVYSHDLAGYRLVRPFMREVLDIPAVIAARTRADVTDLVSIGAREERIALIGDLKADAAAVPALPASLAPLAARTMPLLVGGSTHRGEETRLLDALLLLRGSVPAVRLALAPRHVSRAAEIADAGRRHGLRVWRLSDGARANAWDVLVIDRFGELSSLYAAADVAIVGGTLTRRGGHNVLEPAASGCVPVVGPHDAHIRQHVAGLAHAGGVLRCAHATPAAIADAVAPVLMDRHRLAAMAASARAYVGEQRGAADRAVDLLLAISESGRWPAAPARSPHAASAARS